MTYDIKYRKSCLRETEHVSLDTATGCIVTTQGLSCPPPLCSRVLLCLGGGKMVLNVMLVDRFFLLVQFLHDPLKKRPRHKQFHFDAYE